MQLRARESPGGFKDPRKLRGFRISHELRRFGIPLFLFQQVDDHFWMTLEEHNRDLVKGLTLALAPASPALLKREEKKGS